MSTKEKFNVGDVVEFDSRYLEIVGIEGGKYIVKSLSSSFSGVLRLYGLSFKLVKESPKDSISMLRYKLKELIKEINHEE